MSGHYGSSSGVGGGVEVRGEVGHLGLVPCVGTLGLTARGSQRNTSPDRACIGK